MLKNVIIYYVDVTLALVKRKSFLTSSTGDIDGGNYRRGVMALDLSINIYSENNNNNKKKNEKQINTLIG